MKAKLKFFNLTPKMKTNLQDGAILTAALASGYGLFTAFGTSLFPKNRLHDLAEMSSEEQYDEVNNEVEICSPKIIEAEVGMGLTVSEPSDEMSFSDAFAEARANGGPGSLFNYRGKTYTSYYLEEVEQLSQEDQKEFATNIDENIDEDSITEVDIPIQDLEDDDMPFDYDGGKDDHDQSIDEVEEVIDEVEIIDLGDDQFDHTEVVEEDVVTEVDFSDFEDELFDQDYIELPESSDSSSSEASYDFADFNDPLFIDSEVVEPSSEASEGFAFVDNSDFNDPLFADSNEFAETSNEEGDLGLASVDHSDFDDILFNDTTANTDDVALEVSSDELEQPEGIVGNENIEVVGDEIIASDDFDTDIEVDDEELETDDFFEPEF